MSTHAPPRAEALASEDARAEQTSKLTRQVRCARRWGAKGRCSLSSVASLFCTRCQLLAACGAGVMTKTSVAPIERLKVIFQTAGADATTVTAAV